MHIEVPSMPVEILHSQKSAAAESSKTVQLRVQTAYSRQLDRANKPNNKLTSRDIEDHCKLDASQTKLLEQAIDQLGLSARAMHRILKVARTIADLAESSEILTEHLTEAITYRRLERTELAPG